MAKSKHGHVWRVAIGVPLIALGLVGLVLPIIPGLPLLAAGLLVIGVDHPRLRPLAEWLRRHHVLRRRPPEDSR
jgi:uncharacterized protein YqgC (DUF456 family)